jgi:hypothetical protein
MKPWDFLCELRMTDRQYTLQHSVFVDKLVFQRGGHMQAHQACQGESADYMPGLD